MPQNDVELKLEINDLEGQITVLNDYDTIRKLRKEIKRRTLVVITPDMGFFSRTRAKIENFLKRSERLSLVNHATSIVFIASVMSTILTYIFYKTAILDAATLSLSTGLLSEFGAFINNKYGTSNSVPTAYTPPVEPVEDVNVSVNANSENTPVMTDTEA